MVNQYFRDSNFRSQISRESILKTPLAKLAALLKPFGLTSKASTIKNLAALKERSPENILQVKGVGLKIFDVYSNVLFGRDNVAVDTHTFQFFKKVTNLKMNLDQTRKILNCEVDTPYKK